MPESTDVRAEARGEVDRVSADVGEADAVDGTGNADRVGDAGNIGSVHGAEASEVAGCPKTTVSSEGVVGDTGAPQHPTAQTAPGFSVNLDVFDGPFDLLLRLISKHELDITEISLSRVTGEFIAYLKGLDTEQELEQASEFLVVAATLLDLKVVGLLPQGELVDAEDVALLEARDLLFARLLQYRAFKEVSVWFAESMNRESTRHYRSVRLEEKYRKRTPELLWTLSPEDFAALAALALAPKEIATVGFDHLHSPLVSIREQAALVAAMLRRGEPMSFRQLIAGVELKGVVVARFLAVLELYRHAAISFEQIEPLGELTLRWSAESWSDEQLATLGADYDR